MKALRSKITLILIGAVLLAAFAFSLHVLSIHWFITEINRVDHDPPYQQAVEAAMTIQTASSATRADPSRLPHPDLEPKEVIKQLVRHNPKIVAAVLVLPGVGRGWVKPHSSPLATDIEPTAFSVTQTPQSELEGLIIEEVQVLYRDVQPDIIPIELPGQGECSLYVFIDRQAPNHILERASARLASRMAVVLPVFAGLVVLALLLLTRRRSVARRRRRALDREEHLAYVGALAAGLAHEIRNPLNALSMQLEMLDEDVSDELPQRAAPRISRIRSGLAGVERTVHEFLTYAAPEQQKPYMMKLAPEVEAICRQYEEAGGPGAIHIERVVAPDLAAWCDPHALRQVLSNLLSNAVRALEGRPPPRRIRLEASRLGEAVELTLDDAGRGVPAEDRGEIFKCFYTTNSDGTGLGLAIARQLSEAIGGRLELADGPSPLGGARFTLRLRAQPPD